MKKLLNEWRQFLKESQEFDEEEMVNEKVNDRMAELSKSSPSKREDL